MVLGGVLGHSPVVDALVMLVATALIWVGSGWLESSAEALSGYYGLPAVVQGSIVVAVGSSFPELASVVFTALAGVFEMGVGSIVGSAIFNILVIPALSGIVSEGDLETNRTVVYKEAQFYMIAVAVLVITFALAVIYAPAGDLAGTLTPSLALIPLLLYGLYLFIQWQDVADHEATPVEGVNVRRQWLTLGGGLLFILVAVEQLVGAVESLGATFGVPEFLAGVTVIAAATSLPDTLVSVRTARDDEAVTSLGNVLGSNTFDLLVAIPVGVFLVAATGGAAVTVDFAVAVPMFAVLTLATVLLFALLRTDLSLSGPESYSLLVTYLAFVAWVVAESAGVTSVIQGV